MRLSAIGLLALLLTGAWPVDLSSNPPSPRGGISQTEEQRSASKEHSDRNDAQPNPPSSPTTVERKQSDNQNTIASETQKEGYWYASPDWWLAIFTGMLFLATAGLWFFTGLLWNTTRKAVADGEHAVVTANAAVAAANRHVAEATRSAAAMERVATAMQDQVGEVRADRRAWLLVMAVSNYRLNANGGFDVDVTIQNFGRSPAINVLMTGFLTPTHSGILDIALARRGTDVDNTRYNNGFLIGPGEVIDQPVNLYNCEVLSLGERNTVVDHTTLKSGDYLLLGCITYGDPLNNEPSKPPYFTKFCFRPEGEARSGNPSDVICVALKKCHFFDSLQ